MALVPVVFVVGVGAVRVLRAGLRRRGPLPPLHARVGEVAEGSVVRVRGRVRVVEGFTSRGGRRDVVIASYLASRRDFGLRVYTAVPLRVLEAIDFRLVLAGGEEVRVRVAGMKGLRAPVPDRSILSEPPLSGAGSGFDSDGQGGLGLLTHSELVIAHGDAVEVSGVVGREVDAGAEGGYRGGRLIPSLRSEGPIALSVQPLDEPFFAPDSANAPAFTGSPPSVIPRG